MMLYNANQRVRLLVLHYTERPFDESFRLLTQTNVSAHYLISEEGQIYPLVDESLSAWHAGTSYWQGRTAINDISIGIEIVNLGFEFPYPEQQIKSVIALSQSIIDRYQIHPTCVVGHSDIAPDRKKDPGPLFPWKTLADAGVGAWPKASKLDFTKTYDMVWLQNNLKKYGYQINITGQFDTQTKLTLTAFQMHFRPSDYSGMPDQETCAILAELIQIYF